MQKDNYFIEGLQGAGKSTLVQKLSAHLPEHTVFREGDYSPVELAWCTSPILFSHVIISRLFPKQVNIAKHHPIIPEIIKQASIVEIHRHIAFGGHS